MSRPTFRDYREIVARHATAATETACGHAIAEGDRIGYAPLRHKALQCADCWRRWSAENAEAAMLEGGA